MTTAAPALISTNLVGAAGLDGREALRLTFSEAIQAGNGWVAIHKADGTLVERFHIAISSRVSLVGAVLTITPTWSLESSADYYITIDSGAVLDLDGNGFAGVTATQPLSFRTGAESLNNTVEEPFLNTFPGNNVQSIGTHRMLYVRTTFSDILNAPWSEQVWRDEVTTLDEFWAYGSYGRLTVANTFVPLATLEQTLI